MVRISTASISITSLPPSNDPPHEKNPATLSQAQQHTSSQSEPENHYAWDPLELLRSLNEYSEPLPLKDRVQTNPPKSKLYPHR